LNLALIAPISGIVALIFATYLAIHVLKKPKGNGRILDISNTIKEGTMAFLNRQFITVTFFGVILTVILYMTSSAD